MPNFVTGVNDIVGSPGGETGQTRLKEKR